MSALNHLIEANNRNEQEPRVGSGLLHLDSQTELPQQQESEAFQDGEVSQSSGELSESVSPV